MKRDVEGAKIEGMKPNPKKPITVKFNSDVSSNMSWEFKPQQREIVVCIT